MLPTASLITLALASTAIRPVETVTAPHGAQIRLAQVLAAADAIESITANDRTITFALDDGGEQVRVVATVTPEGGVRAIAISALAPAAAERGPFSWLAAALRDATAVTNLAVDPEGRVRLTTDTDEVYLVLPGRGASATNMAVEARWAAAWDTAAR